MPAYHAAMSRTKHFVRCSCRFRSEGGKVCGCREYEKMIFGKVIPVAAWVRLLYAGIATEISFSCLWT
jgi:hypothetical protein